MQLAKEGSHRLQRVVRSISLQAPLALRFVLIVGSKLSISNNEINRTPTALAPVINRRYGASPLWQDSWHYSIFNQVGG